MSRQNVISECAEKIMNIRIDHPLRVGVSGITASGKTTLANEIARELQARGRKVIRTSIDQFHHPIFAIGGEKTLRSDITRMHMTTKRL